MISHVTFRNMLDTLISADDDELSSDRRNDIVYAALERYGKDKPDTATEDVTGDGGRYYVLATVLDHWSEGFSRVVKIEYPAATVASDETPTYLDAEDWQDDYWAEASGTQTRYVYLPHHAPAATESMRITYSLPYVWSGTPPAVDIPPADFYAVCQLAAGLCCQALAAKYSRTSDSTIAADSVSHTSRAGEFARRAREFIGEYEKHLGIGKEAVSQAAGTFVDFDTAPGWPSGRQFIFHGRDVR